jgi:hypothetical protein
MADGCFSAADAATLPEDKQPETGAEAYAGIRLCDSEDSLSVRSQSYQSTDPRHPFKIRPETFAPRTAAELPSKRI